MKNLCITIWFLLATVGFAFAAGDIDGAQVSTFDNFVTNTVQPLILSLLATVITVAVGYITSLLKKKFGLEISTATQQRISTIAYDAVHAVEERGAAYAKEKGEKWASECKYNEALNYVLSRVPTLSREEADAKIHTALATIRGLGATKGIGA